MNGQRRAEPTWIGVVCRVYRGALWLYPASHRKRWGEAMCQAFRDRCREAARAGRGPLQVLLAEALPDLAASASREHVAALTEASATHRVTLSALLLCAGAALFFHQQLGDAAVAARDRWTAYQQALDDRALREHEARLAADVEARGGGHADVVAAQLYWAAGEGFGRMYPDASGLALDAAEAAASDALLDRADRAFGRALDANDTWAWWRATSGCPARAAVCRSGAAIDRLQAVDPDNGATWLLTLNRAHNVGDAAGERAALARLARSERFDWHYGDAMRAMLGAFSLRSTPSRARQPFEGGKAATGDDSGILLGSQFAAAGMSSVAPAFEPLSRQCRVADPRVDPALVADCRAAGQLIAMRGSAAIDVMIGYAVWLRATAEAERGPIAQRKRDQFWMLAHFADIAPERSPEAARRWRSAWAAGGSEMDVIARLLRQRGIATQAPAGFAGPRTFEVPAD